MFNYHPALTAQGRGPDPGQTTHRVNIMREERVEEILMSPIPALWSSRLECEQPNESNYEAWKWGGGERQDRCRNAGWLVRSGLLAREIQMNWLECEEYGAIGWCNFTTFKHPLWLLTNARGRAKHVDFSIAEFGNIQRYANQTWPGCGQTCSKVRKFKKLKTQLWEGKGWGAFLSSYVKQIHSTLSEVLIKLLSSFKQRRD